MSHSQKIRIAVNGPGRIGRAIIRAIFEEKMQNDFEIVAINGSAPIETISHLLRYDSVHGTFNHKIEIIDHNLHIDGKKILLTAERDPLKIDWKSHKIDIVFECTGAFTKYEDAYAIGYEDMARRVPDITKLNLYTGWHPNKSIQTIIDDISKSI